MCPICGHFFVSPGPRVTTLIRGPFSLQATHHKRPVLLERLRIILTVAVFFYKRTLPEAHAARPDTA